MTLTRFEIADLLEARAADDETAAEAYELFGRSVFPFEGVFLDLDMGARRPLAEALRSPDGIDVARLCTWVPAFISALADLPTPLAHQVGSGLSTFILRHLGSVSAPVLIGAAPDLGRAETQLSDLVDWLATPARCGLFLSTPVLERIAREAGVPRGFGTRRRLLATMLQSGARYGEATSVIGALRAVVEDHRGRMAATPWRSGALRVATEPWAERLAETSVLLSEVELRLGAMGSADPRVGA